MRAALLFPAPPEPRKPRVPARVLHPLADIGMGPGPRPPGKEWAALRCPRHGKTWDWFAVADYRRGRLPCPRCERHEPEDPPEPPAESWTREGGVWTRRILKDGAWVEDPTPNPLNMETS